MLRRVALVFLPLPISLAAACGDSDDSNPYGVEPPYDGGGTGPGGSAGTGGSAGMPGDGGPGGTSSGMPGGVGDACSTAEPCRSGLACTSGTCEPGRSTPAGGSCVISGECVAGAQCVDGACATAGGGAAGDPCAGDADCGDALRCALVGLATACAPEGTEDVGGTCTTGTDCFGGLACTGGSCTPPLPGVPPFAVPGFGGVSCMGGSSAPVRAYFEVPGATAPAGDTHDFFRLPFPNDVLVSNGTLDLSDFPTPGPGALGVDLVAAYRDAVEASESGWSAYPTVYFRFSSPIDHTSFREDGSGKRPVNWVDITVGDPEYGFGSGLSWFSSEGGLKYVCPNFFAIRRATGRPLEAGHTYAVWLSTDGKAQGGGAIERSPHLVAMLDSAAPADAALAAAYQKYAPFRAYLADQMINPSTVLNATVITVGPVRDTMRDLATAVETAAVPTASNWVRCDGVAASPCPEATGTRACGDSGNALYDEYHALVRLPIFQQGTAPYETSGGAVTTSTPVRSEDVCMALTVPAGTPPAAGWPVAVFAHGTGGSFRSHVRAEVAQVLANAVSPTGIVNFATLGFDLVQHGPRRGGSTKSPDGLFFNFLNPDAARGNVQQGAADIIAMARFAATVDVTAAQTGGDAIKLDGSRMVLFAHSQGATHASLALPYTDAFSAAVLSGNGASLMHSLLTKTQPVNIAAALPFVIGDVDTQSGGLAGGDKHPVLALLQHYIDPADPLNFARVAGQRPEAGRSAKHLFQTYGLGDSFSTAITLETYALAGRLGLAAAHSSVTMPDAIGGLMETPVPVAGNVTVAAQPVTLVVRQYANAGTADGHFVAFDVPGANSDVVRFLAMAARGDVPQVGM